MKARRVVLIIVLIIVVIAAILLIKNRETISMLKYMKADQAEIQAKQEQLLEEDAQIKDSLGLSDMEISEEDIAAIESGEKTAEEVAQSIGLENVRFSHARGEEIKDKYDFVVTRAVMSLVDLMKVVRKNIHKDMRNSMPNGIIALKGGELDREMAPMRKICVTWDLKDFFSEEYFQTKKVVHVTVR